MSTLSRGDVIKAFGDLDEVVVAEIIATGATPAELAEAQAWASNDEALINAGRPLATGRVARLVEIINRKTREEEELQESPPQGLKRRAAIDWSLEGGSVVRSLLAVATASRHWPVCDKARDANRYVRRHSPSGPRPPFVFRQGGT
jgi:hypothetical protein